MQIFEKVNSSPYFIAEAGLNHNGNLNLAHEIIELSHRAGADAVKFQKRTVSQLAIKQVLDSEDSRFPFLGSTYREIRESLEFNFSEYVELKNHADSLNLDFLVTPFDIEAIEFLRPLNLEAFKVASHSVRNLDFLHSLANENKPIIMSTGMSTLHEIDAAIKVWQTHGIKYALLHCVSSYPTVDDDANLDVIKTLKKRYGVTVGYSGHEVDDLASIVAVSLGAKIVERHVTTDKKLNGFDHKLSLDEKELELTISKLRRVASLIGNPEKTLLTSELVAREKYNVSMVSKRDLLRGDILKIEDVTWKNPGTGIARSDRDLYIGKKLLQNVGEDCLLLPEMFE